MTCLVLSPYPWEYRPATGAESIGSARCYNPVEKGGSSFKMEHGRGAKAKEPAV